MNSRERAAIAGAVALTGVMGALLVWLVNTGWTRLPPWLAVIVFVVLAVFVIGSPIWALARWSERWLARQRAQPRGPGAGGGQGGRTG